MKYKKIPKIMITKIEQIWLEFVAKQKDNTGLAMKRYSAEIKPDCFVAMHLPEKTRCIAFRISIQNINVSLFNSLQDLKAEIIEDHAKANKSLLVLSLADASLSSIFAVLCEDLFYSIAETESEVALLQTLQSRFLKWKELFNLAKTTGLSPEKQIGLFGELYLLKNLMRSTQNPEFCLNIWVGPDGGIRDFENNNTAIEVKTSQSHNHQKIRISSERQLDSSLLGNLFLFHLSLEKRNGDEYSLNTIIEEIYELLGEEFLLHNVFKRKLTNVGYFEHQRDHYQNVSYIVRDESFYFVKDKFPRIEEHDLMKGVGDVKYSIILSAETEKYKTDLTNALQNILL